MHPTPKIECGKEGLRIRTDGLQLGFVDRREGSMVHCLRETGPDGGVGDDIHWTNRSEHLLSRRRVAPVSRISFMFSSVNTEQG